MFCKMFAGYIYDWLQLVLSMRLFGFVGLIFCLTFFNVFVLCGLEIMESSSIITKFCYGHTDLRMYDDPEFCFIVCGIIGILFYSCGQLFHSNRHKALPIV